MFKKTNGEKTLPNTYVAKEAMVAFSILTVTNLLEGNPLSTLLALQGALAGTYVAKVFCKEDSMVSVVKHVGSDMKNLAGVGARKLFSLFFAAPHQEAVVENAAVMKKTN
jgi:hypothetical protein